MSIWPRNRNQPLISRDVDEDDDGCCCRVSTWIWNKATSQTSGLKRWRKSHEQAGNTQKHDTQILDNILNHHKTICELEAEKLLLSRGASCLPSVHLIQTPNQRSTEAREPTLLKSTISKKWSPTQWFEKNKIFHQENGLQVPTHYKKLFVQRHQKRSLEFWIFLSCIFLSFTKKCWNWCSQARSPANCFVYFEISHLRQGGNPSGLVYNLIKI